MYTYEVIHTRKVEALLSEALNSQAKKGFKLHTLIEKPSAFMLIFEKEEIGDQIEAEKPRTRKPKSEPILVTSEDNHAG